MKRIILFSVILSIIHTVSAQIPAGYYNNAGGLSGDNLKSALHNIIDDHTENSYSDLWNILVESDEDPNNSDHFILIYTGRSLAKTEVYPAWNREHVWAKSHGDFGTTPPAGTDAHHIRPSDVSVNADRGNKDFDDGGTAHSEATECNWDADSWEPRDDVKGDVARMMFYMAVRYEGDVAGEPDLELVDYITGSTSSPIFGKLSTLLAWHNQDPVDDFERNRNNVVYSHQNNRNPFVDSSQYVARIWGSSGNALPSITEITTSPENPTSTDAVSISATITDSDGTITSAELHWGMSSGSLSNTITMAVSPGDVYTTDSDIPAQSDGTTVYYEIVATDNNSGSNTSTENSYTVSGGSSGNDTIFQEDFETVTPDAPIAVNGWTRYEEQGTATWMGKEYESNKYAQMTAYSSGESTNISWLITPEIDLTDKADATFSFISKDAYNNGDPVEVFISTDFSGTGDPNEAGWTKLNPTLATGSSSGYASSFTESGNVDLTAYCGNNIYIAYKYTGGDPSLTTTIQIDDVLITGTTITNEAPQITNVSHNPQNPEEGETVTISATVTDSDGSIASVVIRWGTTQGNYDNPVNMIYSGSDNIYTGVIPSQPGGTSVYYLIEATDDDSQSVRSGENSFSYNTAGNSVPVISNVSFTPSVPESTDKVIVSATITDPDGVVSSAQLKWGTASGNYTNTITMDHSEDDYFDTIPAQSVNTEVFFVIQANDNDGGVTTSSEYNYTVKENLIPVISDVLLQPSVPTSGDDVIVSCVAEDPDGQVESVLLEWKVGETGTLTETKMNLSGGKYYGQISRQDAGKTIYFIVVAEDNLGGVATYKESYEVSESNGVGDITKNNIKIFPNPVSEFIHLQIENYRNPLEITIYDVIGRIVYQETADFSSQHKISVGGLDSGLYFVSFVLDNTLISKKIIVNKE